MPIPKKRGAGPTRLFSTLASLATISSLPVAAAQSIAEKPEVIAKLPAGILSLSLAPQQGATQPDKSQPDTLAAVTYKGTVLLGTKLGNKQWSSQFERILFCNPDTLLLSTYRGQLVVCNAADATPRFSIGIQEPRTDLAASPVAAHHDLLAFSYFAPAITLWNTRTGREQTTLRLTWRDFLQPADVGLRQDLQLSKARGATARAATAGPNGYQAKIDNLAFSSSGQMLAAGMVVRARQGAVYGKVGVWDVKSKRLMALLRCNGEVADVAFSPREDALACLTGSGNVLLWKWPRPRGDKQVNQSSDKLTLSKYYGTAIAGGQNLKWSPDGQTLAVTCEQKLLLLDPATLKLRRTIQDKSGINKFAFSSDSRSVYTGHEDGTIRRWPLPSSPR